MHKRWLQRTYKWNSHQIVEEILNIFSNEILKDIISDVKAATYFPVILDETSDISGSEQVSISFRYVDNDLTVHEQFVGFYETKTTTAEVLHNIVKDVLLRFDLNISNLRGQCYDGASNVRFGLSSRISNDEPRALYIHCVAHRLNLVVTDAMNGINSVSDFIGTIKSMTNYVRDSPKRLGFFKDLQQDSENTESHSPPPRGLIRFCQTRWCVRVQSLESILSNYEALMNFFDEMADDKKSESSARAMANGFFSKLESFDFFFKLKMLIDIFKQLEIANTKLQYSDLTINKSYERIVTLLDFLRTKRDQGFDSLWTSTVEQAEVLHVDSPTIPRVRKAPKRYDSESEPHRFEKPEMYYKKLFYEVLDTVITSLEDRFNTKESKLLRSIEDFLIKEKHSSPKDIINFYKNEFNEDRFTLHRDMLIDVFKNTHGRSPETINDVISFLRNDKKSIREMIPEIDKLCHLILTLPASTCVAERSFSMLRRLKTYLRNTLCALRLNQIAVINCHRERAEKLKKEHILRKLMNFFINSNRVRAATFAVFDVE